MYNSFQKMTKKYLPVICLMAHMESAISCNPGSTNKMGCQGRRFPGSDSKSWRQHRWHFNKWPSRGISRALSQRFPPILGRKFFFWFRHFAIYRHLQIFFKHKMHQMGDFLMAFLRFKKYVIDFVPSAASALAMRTIQVL